MFAGCPAKAASHLRAGTYQEVEACVSGPISELAENGLVRTAWLEDVASGLKRRRANGGGVVPGHVDDGHSLASRFEMVPDVDP